MLEATSETRIAPSVATKAENALMGCSGSLWLLVGGFMLCLTGWGAFIGLPMITTALVLPIAEFMMAWKDQDWSGARPSAGPVPSVESGRTLAVKADPDVMVPPSVRAEAPALHETLRRWRQEMHPGEQPSEVVRRTLTALDELVGVLGRELR